MLLLAILSRKMVNLFENFMRVLEKYFEDVCLFFEYLDCLIFLCGLFDNSDFIWVFIYLISLFLFIFAPS